ncbi:MAG: HEAT repeat domain-containing protein [Promethearchaeota archaeon]
MNWHDSNTNFNTLIKQLFQAEDWQKRAEAARELGLMKDGRAVNLLCKALKSEKDETVIDRIIEALGRIGDARATIRIIEKLNEELNKYEGNKFRIIYILESLKRIKDKRALGYICSLLNSPDENLKTLTEETFDAIEPNWQKIVSKEKKKKISIEDIFRKRV